MGARNWMVSNYSTMPSQGNYFTNLLNQEVIDVFDSEDNVEVDHNLSDSSIVNSQPKQKGRSNNFVEEEDKLLVLAYVNISKDPITGWDQKDGKFWERVENYFHANREFELDHNWSSLRHRWGIIQKEVGLFQSYYNAIERKNESGKTMNDKIGEAKEMFHKLQKRFFLCSMRGSFLDTSQSGHLIENPRWLTQIWSHRILMSRVTSILKDHREGKLRRKMYERESGMTMNLIL